MFETAMKATVHLGQNYHENLVTYRNTNSEELKDVVDITQKLILDQNLVILNVPTMEWKLLRGLDLLCYMTKINWAKAKVHVNRDSVSLSGKDARALRSQCKVERSASSLPTVQRRRIFSG